MIFICAGNGVTGTFVPPSTMTSPKTPASAKTRGGEAGADSKALSKLGGQAFLAESDVWTLGHLVLLASWPPAWPLLAHSGCIAARNSRIRGPLLVALWGVLL